MDISPVKSVQRLIELPLAYRSILAGIKTSAIMNIGTATTLGALISATDYRQPILTGIRLDNISLILQSAIPDAALALLAQEIENFTFSQTSNGHSVLTQYLVSEIQQIRRQ